MQDAGLSPADALLKAEAFYIQKPIGQSARYRLAAQRIGAECLLRRPSSDSSQYDGLDVATAS